MPSARQWDGPLGAGMTSDGCQEAKCQDQLRCTGAGAYWCVHEHHQVMCSARLAGPLWTGTQSCTDLLSSLVASSSLQAEDRGEQHPGVVAAFSVPAWGGSPAATQGSCSSCSPSRGSQVWASCFFLSLSLTSHQQAKKNPWQFLLGPPGWSFPFPWCSRFFHQDTDRCSYFVEGDLITARVSHIHHFQFRAHPELLSAFWVHEVTGLFSLHFPCVCQNDS